MQTMRGIRIYLAAFFIFFSGIHALMAKGGDFGAGFILGDPSGVTGKYFFSGDDAADFGFGASSDDGFYIYGDYLKHFYNIFPVHEIALYFGVGGGFQHHDRDHRKDHNDEEYNSIDLRIPFGAEYRFTKVPLGIFLDIAPCLEIIPEVDFDLRGGLGVRYYF